MSTINTAISQASWIYSRLQLNEVRNQEFTNQIILLPPADARGLALSEAMPFALASLKEKALRCAILPGC
ncbi:MAG: hypothetical protein V7K77_00385 [Nostoc sp.]|uniref:hypothetical protein n=1 Tax=Nostoc sp. TaxID=1180 RepID=UPI002FF701BF